MFVDPNACGVALPMVGFDSENHLVLFSAQGDTKVKKRFIFDRGFF